MSNTSQPGLPPPASLPGNPAASKAPPAAGPAPVGKLSDSVRAATVIALCVAAVWLVGRATGAPDGLVLAAALVASTVCCWALGVLPEPATTLLFFLCAVVLHVAPASVVFSGFASTAWWLMFGGAVTGVALAPDRAGAAPGGHHLPGPGGQLSPGDRHRGGERRGTGLPDAFDHRARAPVDADRAGAGRPAWLCTGLQRPHRHGADGGRRQLYAAHHHPAGQYPEQRAAGRGQLAVWHQPELWQLPLAAFSHPRLAQDHDAGLAGMPDVSGARADRGTPARASERAEPPGKAAGRDPGAGRGRVCHGHAARRLAGLDLAGGMHRLPVAGRGPGFLAHAGGAGASHAPDLCGRLSRPWRRGGIHRAGDRHQRGIVALAAPLAGGIPPPMWPRLARSGRALGS